MKGYTPRQIILAFLEDPDLDLDAPLEVEAVEKEFVLYAFRKPGVRLSSRSPVRLETKSPKIALKKR
jgi:hypothetical protein